MLVVSALLGASFAWTDGSPVPDDRPVSNIWLTVTSEVPGVEFGVISGEPLSRNTRVYRTPRTFSIEAVESSVVVVPVQRGESLTVKAVQSVHGGDIQLHSGAAPYHLYRFGPDGISVSYPGPGRLATALEREGIGRTGVHFGDIDPCVGADIFDLVLQERFAEARAHCERWRWRP